MAEAEERKNDMVSLGANPEDIVIQQKEATTPQPELSKTEQSSENPEIETEQEAEPLPESEMQLDQDPVNWMPDHFIDTIQGVPTVNRKGYCVIAERYNVSVTSEAKVRASETDFEYAEFEAVAVTEDGRQYSGFGSAHVARQDGDDPYLLNELAETRAMKRAVSWATGVGMTAIEEMQGNL
jgi:hypothetical protein